MTPDEAKRRALEAAVDAFSDGPQDGLAPWIAGVERAIEAYESALWQPIETVPLKTEVIGFGRVGWDEGDGMDNPETEPRAIAMEWQPAIPYENEPDWPAHGKAPSATPYTEVVHATHWRPKIEGPSS